MLPWLHLQEWKVVHKVHLQEWKAVHKVHPQVKQAVHKVHLQVWMHLTVLWAVALQVGIWLHHLQLMILWELYLTAQLRQVMLVLQEDNKALVQIQWLICLIQERNQICQSLRKTTKAVALQVNSIRDNSGAH